MKSIKLVLLLLLVVALAVAALQNQQPWEVRFLWLSGDMPGIILLFFTAVVGFAVGSTVTLLLKRGSKQQHSDKNKSHEP